MKKIIRYLVLVVAAAFIIAQFFQPKKNLGEITSNHIFNQEQLPGNIKSIIENACLDCHSDKTTYLWYHKIAPVSWMVREHITDGKKELNFSNWGKLDMFDKIKTLEEICHETERKTMPIKSYTFMHRKAKLSSEQIAEICTWSESLSEEILEKAIN